MDEIVEAALQVGLDRLTMRRLAARLGVGASTLYYHLESRDELNILVGGYLLRKLRLQLADPNAWEQAMRRGAHELRRVFERVPGLARVLSDPRLSDTAMQLNEDACSFLIRAGFAPAEAWLAVRAMADFVGAFVLRAQAWEAAGGSELDHVVAGSEAEAFPALHAARRALGADSVEPRFDFALDCLLGGLRRVRSRPNS